MSASQHFTPITVGRPVLHTGGLAALAATILARAASIPASVGPALALVTDITASVPIPGWASPMAEIRRLSALSEGLYLALADTLTTDQRALLDEYARVSSDQASKESEWRVLEIARHLPKVAPTIRLLHQHVQHVSYQQPSPCCPSPSVFEGRD